MRTSINGIELIKHFEGYSPVAYLCPANYLTIGYGHLIKEKEKHGITGTENYQITKFQAENLLLQDLIIFESAIMKFISVPLKQNQFDALISFTYNLGQAALQRSSLRQKLNRGEYDIAANEFLRWIYAAGHKLPGLIKRRKAEYELFLS